MKRPTGFLKYRNVATILLLTALAGCTLQQNSQGPSPSTSASASAQTTMVKFDVPNSSNTFPTSINPAGEITGSYVDATGVHGFLRHEDGSFISFDAPDIDGTPVGTAPISINAAGEIAGYVSTVGLTQHSFLRRTDGTFTLFNLIGAPCRLSGVKAVAPNQSFSGDGDVPSGINARGQITGIYGNGCYQSYLRDPDGTLTLFGPPADAIPITQAQAINACGQITGSYFSANTFRGFLRESDGSITTFDGPGSETFPGTHPSAISPGGDITGSAADHGFLRSPDGSTAAFAVPDSIRTTPAAINPEGQIAGTYLDKNFATHGFLRQQDGTLTTFDIPNSTSTSPTAMNSRGEIAGSYSDAGGTHGFVMKNPNHKQVPSAPGDSCKNE